MTSLQTFGLSSGGARCRKTSTETKQDFRHMRAEVCYAHTKKCVGCICRHNGRNDVSIYTSVGSGLELIDCIPAKDEPETKCSEEYERAFSMVTMIAGEKKMDQMTNPEVRRESPSAASYAKRTTTQTIQKLRALNPSFIEELEEALGMIA